MRGATFEVAGQPRPDGLAGDRIIDLRPPGADLRGLETRYFRVTSAGPSGRASGTYCSQLYLFRPTNVIEVEVEGIGILRNPVTTAR